MNKYELAKKINELDGLTNEEKSELLKLLRSQKKYGLVWEDKPENAELKMVDEMPVLEEVPERAIVSDDPDAPNHVLIEGDNLEALTALTYTHTGKIDVIYLKPLRYMGNADSREDRPNMYYGVEAPDGTLVYPIRSDGSDGRWRWGKDKLEKEKSRLDFVKGKIGWSVYTRLYADNMSDVPVESIWYNKDVESNRQAIALIKQIFGSEKTFSNPKPIKLIQRTISIVGSYNSIVLDFFAGSGTTLHATMQLNSEDGGHRQCILVQGIEKNENKKDKLICENVTYERNRRVIQGYTTPKGEEVPGLTHNNLRYYKTKLLPRQQTVKNKRAVTTQSFFKMQIALTMGIVHRDC